MDGAPDRSLCWLLSAATGTLGSQGQGGVASSQIDTLRAKMKSRLEAKQVGRRAMLEVKNTTSEGARSVYVHWMCARGVCMHWMCARGMCVCTGCVRALGVCEP